MGRHVIICRVGFALEPTLEEMDMTSMEWIEGPVCQRALVVGEAEDDGGHEDRRGVVGQDLGHEAGEEVDGADDEDGGGLADAPFH